ncbi:MAG: dethiobiotin synthetase [Solirubrobacteraceae bacterium]|nr:dethiobiotin synthetase [Solirubrobacteraceae bacterium]
MTLRGCFVTGTDTGAGKTVVAAAIVAALRAQGATVAAFKPVVTGVGADSDDDAWPADHELLAGAAGCRPEDVTARTFEPAVSPHLAAELAGTELVFGDLVAAARQAAIGAEILVVEGVGGLLVPLNTAHDIRDLAVALALPLVIAARPGLGTINHSLLTIEAARAAGLDVRGVVLTPWPEEPTVMERSNRDTIARAGGVAVAGLPPTSPDVADLAAAGATLPLDGWLAP